MDIEKLRAETPGCAHVVHLNNAGAALPPAPVLNAMVRYLEEEARHGGYEQAARARDAVQRPYHALAEMLNARPDEIALVESATRGWGGGFFGLRWQPGDRIITGRAEYASNYIAFLQVKKWHGVAIDIADETPDGATDPQSIAALIRPETKLIALTHVPTNGGLVNPAAAIGNVAQDAGVPFLLDACQSIGQLDLDVKKLGCDMLSGTGRKYLRAPRGTGFLWVRRGLLEKLEPPMLDLHGAEWTEADQYRIKPDATRFENFESSVAAQVGLGVALDYALALGMPAIEAQVRRNARQLRDMLATVKGVQITDSGTDPCGIVTFTMAGVDPDAIKQEMSQQAINVLVSRRPSTRLDMTRRGLDSLVRASVHYYNNDFDVTRLVTALAKIQPN